MGEIIKEYNRYAAMFYLIKRDTLNTKTSDPVLKYYEWWIAYRLCTTAEIEEYLEKVYLEKNEFIKKILYGPVVLTVPAHDPSYYVKPIRKKKEHEILYYRRQVILPSGNVVDVNVPVIFFDSDCWGHVHMLYSIVLATYEDPNRVWKDVYDWCNMSCLWIMLFTLLAQDRYRMYEGEIYLTEGLKQVLNVGRCYRILYGLL